VASFEQLGRIEVSHSSPERPPIDPSIDPSREPIVYIGNVDTSGEGGGRIFIRGGELVADNGWILADTPGSEEGQGIDIGATGQVTMRNGASISASALNGGPGGNVTVTADSVSLSGITTGIAVRTISTGIAARNITVTASNLEMRNGAGILADDNVTVTADRMFLSGDGANFMGFPIPTIIFASSITVTAGNLEVHSGAEISAESSALAGQGVM
jgi:hypothetical protein